MTARAAVAEAPAREIEGRWEVRTARTSRGPVEYAEHGEGPAVVTIHGAMGGHDQSAMLARTIGEPGYRYLAISRPGYLGTAISAGRSSAEQADLLAELLDSLRIRRAAVMAVSGGGPMALRFALRHGDRASALVLVSTIGGKIDQPLPFAFYLMRFLAGFPPFARSLRNKALRDPEGILRRSILDPEIRARLLADPVAGPLHTELVLSTFDRMKQRLPGTLNDVRVTRTETYPLEQIRTPTLVIHGTGDRVAPFEQGGKITAARIPGAEPVMVPGGEHVTIFTHRQVVRPRVCEFLRRHVAAVAPEG